MNPKRNVIVTRGPWGYGNISGSGIKGYRINPHRFFRTPDGKDIRGKDGRPLPALQGTLNGVTVATLKEARELGLVYGYTKYYGRNTCGFVMSKAARKRGYVTTNGQYNRRTAEGKR